MLKPERYDKIVNLVNAKSVATVEELCDELQVSKATIRRDLLQLDKDRVLIRTHGGAMKASKSITAEVPIYLRSHIQKEEKARIGAAAAKLVSEGETIYIGTGTTTRAMASYLGEYHQLTVLTNDISVAAEVAKTDNALIVAGGQLKTSSYTLVGFFTEEMLQELQVDTAFFAADYVSIKGGYMDCSMDEVNIKRIMINNASKTVLLCGSNKFKGKGFMTICPITDVDVTISNEDLDSAIVRRLEESGMEVILV